MKKIRVTVWNEYTLEKTETEAMAIYPGGLHKTIAKFLSECDDLEITLATMEEPCQGLPDELLNNTDVLVWWGHVSHELVDDALVERIRDRVYSGKMGFIALHSAHFSKPFRRIVGTSGVLTWGRNQKEVVWNLMPAHPITAGIPDHFILEADELYSEPFYIPQPDALVFGSWFEDGHIFRSGACFIRGAGKVFYFQPGHETCPSFHNPYVQKIIKNAVYWAVPNDFGFAVPSECPECRTKILENN